MLHTTATITGINQPSVLAKDVSSVKAHNVAEIMAPIRKTVVVPLYPSSCIC